MEELKKALSSLITIAEKTDKALADDGRIDVSEGIGIAMSGVGLIKVIRNANSLKDQFVKLNEQERKELSAWFKEEFDLTNDNIEHIVELIFETLTNLGEVLEAIA